MHRLKYIIVDKNGLELPIVFNGTILTHDEVYRNNSKIVSAGFCDYTERDGWSCWGKSISLRLESRKEDKEILTQFLQE